MAIPFLAIQGYHTLLDSRAGKFVEEPTRTEPGWRAFVDPTPVIGIAEVDQGRVTGVTLLIHHLEVRSAATVVLVPGSLELDGATLAERSASDAVAAVGAALRLSIDRTEAMDEAGWRSLLDDERYLLDSPDPVSDETGGALFTVGQVSVGGDNAAPFLGRPADGAVPISVRPRRHLFWNALLEAPPAGSTDLASDLRAVDDAVVQVVDLPLTQLEPVALIDGPAAESLIRDVVAYPAGSLPGDRLQVRILDRTGGADLEGIAAAIAAQGMEVIEIGNTTPFDSGETQVIAPIGLAAQNETLPDEIETLTRSVGSSNLIIDNEAADDLVVTVVIGPNFDLANLS